MQFDPISVIVQMKQGRENSRALSSPPQTAAAAAPRLALAPPSRS